VSYFCGFGQHVIGFVLGSLLFVFVYVGVIGGWWFSNFHLLSMSSVRHLIAIKWMFLLACMGIISM